MEKNLKHIVKMCIRDSVITANHLEMVLVNLGYEIEHLKRVRLKFSPDIDYSVKIAGQVQQFLKECKTEKDILGIGIAIPGIIDQNEKTVLKSHALQVENYSLRFLEQALGFPVYFENDANSAMLAEDTQKYNNAIYLSLNHTLGGAFCIDGKLFRGQNQKAGEFGHMILIPGGDRCCLLYTSIIQAVVNGRNVYRNIKNAILFLLSGNMAAILAVLYTSLAGLPVPFAPVHLLFINLLTDSLPAICLLYTSYRNQRRNQSGSYQEKSRYSGR